MDLGQALGSNGKGMRWEDLEDNGEECDNYCAFLCQCDGYEGGGEPYVIFPLGELMEWLVADWLICARRARALSTSPDLR